MSSDRIGMVPIHTTLGRPLWPLIKNVSNSGAGYDKNISDDDTSIKFAAKKLLNIYF